MAKKKIDNNLFSAILYIIVGILLITFKGQVVDWAMYVVGAIFVISGILDIAKRFYHSGGTSLVIGLVIILLGILIQEIILRVLGILIVIKGVIALIDALRRKKINVYEVIFAAITIVAGALLIFSFNKVVDVIIIISGILLLIDGIVGIIPSLKR